MESLREIVTYWRFCFATDREERVVKIRHWFASVAVSAGLAVFASPATAGEPTKKPTFGFSTLKAATPEAAIRRHGNEAAASGQAFLSLSDQDRADLLAFLQSL